MHVWTADPGHRDTSDHFNNWPDTISNRIELLRGGGDSPALDMRAGRGGGVVVGHISCICIFEKNGIVYKLKLKFKFKFKFVNLNSLS